MFGLGGQEILIIALIGLLLVGGVVVLIRLGVFGPPKFSRKDDPKP